MSKILANQIANYLDNAPVEIKEGLNVPAGKPLQVNGSPGTTGQVLSSDGSGLLWSDPPYFSGSYNDLTDQPTIPSAQVNSDWNSTIGVTRILNKPLIPPQSSVTVGPAQGGSDLNYNSTSGEFTFTPPDLSSFSTFSGTYADLSGKPDLSVYLTSFTESDPVFTAAPASGITSTQITNWNSSYSWGNHGSVGYLTAESDTLESVTARGATTTSDVTVNDMTVNGDLTVVGTTTSNNQATLNVAATQIIINDGQTGSPTLDGFLKIDRGNSDDVAIKWSEGSDRWQLTNDGSTYYNIPISTSDLTNDSGYLSSFTETDPVFTASAAFGIGSSDITNWNTAFGWGNHAAAGYLTTEADTLDAVVGRGDTTSLAATFGDLTCSNLTVTGTTTQINTTQLMVSDNMVMLNTDVSNTPTENAGLFIERGLSANVGLLWNEGTDRWTFTNDGSIYTNLPLTIGDLANDAGYITGFTETDPIYLASVAATITTGELSNWNAAYSWGDHAQAGYLTSVGAETDPVFLASDAAAVTSAKITNWDSAYGWGDHSGAGYITSYTETDTLDSVLDRGATTTRDISTTGKLYYSNNFALLTDLQNVNAATYHGMFAHVHAEGHGYFAHAGGWVQLLDTGSNLSKLADVATTAPSTSDVLTWDGSNWGPSAPTGGGGSGGANVTTDDSAPSTPADGDLWWKSDEGRLKIYYDDVDSSQWVDASPALSNPNIPVHVGEVELYQGGNQIAWLGSTGVTAAIRATEGGGGFQSPCIRVSFAQAFSASDAYTIQATVYNPSTIGDVYQTSIRKTGPSYFDFQVYNLTDSVVATDFKVALTIYAI